FHLQIFLQKIDAKWKITKYRRLKFKREEKKNFAFIKANALYSIPENPDGIKSFRPANPYIGGINVFDFNSDSYLDILFCGEKRIYLYQNMGGQHFKEITESCGLPIKNVSPFTSALWADFDNDGDYDLFLAINSHYTKGHNLLYENINNHFFDRSSKVNFSHSGRSSQCCLADINNDGLIDIFVGSYGKGDPLPNHYFKANNGGVSLLYLNQGQLKFKEVTREWGMDSTYWTLAACFFDLNGDSFIDLYVVNDFGPNELFINQHGKGFIEAGEKFGLRDYNNSMAALFFDPDRDGDLDILVSNMSSNSGRRITGQISNKQAQVLKRLRELADGNNFYVNNHPKKFQKQEQGISKGEWAYGAVTIDIGNKGRSSIYQVNGFVSNVFNDEKKPDL
ncbi:FG-GAP repeat domain-containing protein, partial [Candidatus Riflebacteria bacterium]